MQKGSVSLTVSVTAIPDGKYTSDQIVSTTHRLDIDANLAIGHHRSVSNTIMEKVIQLIDKLEGDPNLRIPEEDGPEGGKKES